MALELKAEVQRLNETPSLEASAGPISFVLMTYLDKLFAQGYKQTLTDKDLGGISEADRSDLLIKQFNELYENEARTTPLNKRSLWKVLWRTVGYWKLFLALALFALSAAVQFGPVEILTRLVRYLQGVDKYDTSDIWGMVILLFVFPVCGSIALAHSNALMAHMGAQFRNVLICAIYRKALKISPYTKQKLSTGRIITMFSDDTNQIRAFLFFLSNSICAPLQIGACLYMIYRQVGVATFVGLGYTFFTTPVSGVVFGIVFGLRKKKMTFTDARVKLMNEILNGIRIIKTMSWENAFIKKIEAIRSQEISLVAKAGYIFNAAFGLLLLGATQIQTTLIFLTYIGLGNQLDAATAFTTLTLFGLMTSPFIFLPFGLQQYNQSKVSMKRIMEYLDSEDLLAYIQQGEGEGDVAVEFKAANMGWSPGEDAPASDAKVVESGAPASASSSATDADAKSTHEGKQYVAAPSEEEAKADGVLLIDGPSQDKTNRAFHTLRDLSLTVKKGQLVAVVGSVGSGKSSLLSALLGEMVLSSGDLIIHKKKLPDGSFAPASIAYCDQRPWIVNATVEENITFGKPMDEERMKKAIFAACMQDDLKILSAGLKTEIGERGINLSGGQKARVALARAVYNDADIYLLDDPISAVDAHVGMHLVEHCITGALSGKTRFLVTHHLNILPVCDVVLILDHDGTVKASGTYQELMQSGIDLTQYLGHKDEEKEDADKKGKKEQDSSKADEASSTDSGAGATSVKKDGAVEGKGEGEGESGDKSKKEEAKDGALTTVEERKEGNVTIETYTSYAFYGGLVPFFLTIFFQLGSQVLGIEANFWLADWGKETTIDQYKEKFGVGQKMTRERSFFWFNGYCGMQMASIACLFISRMCLNYHRTSASLRFHEKLLHTVLFLPVSFFDTTPVGRVINRFSQDIATIDEDLVQSVSQFIGMGGGVLGAIGAIAGSTQGAFLLLLVPLGWLYGRFQDYFRSSNTAVARIEATSRSPIYADFSQTLSGTSTIRAYGEQMRYITQLEGFANRNTVPGVLQQIAGQWLAIRLDFLGALIMFFMGALCIALNNSGSSFIPAGYLALGLSYSIQLTALLKMAVRVLATIEAQFNSVERVKFYTELTGVEDGGYVSADKKASAKSVGNGDGDADGAGDVQLVVVPPAEWPQEGRVRFEDVDMRYRQGPLVLKKVSFDVLPKEKVGVAGRTGSGKSSLMVALFRIEPLSGGRIIIDGIDIATVPLQILRSRLCIIPQDPVMFSATVRFNLDPFDLYSDEEVWSVLRDVNMENHVNSLPNKLQELVAEGGDNFSAGQRQLVCIARAILRKPRLLVLDEATASIDSETDELIQTMIRSKFKECTVLTIAHRLQTIYDADKILIMDQGVNGEYGPPQELLAREQGLFRSLWDRHVRSGGKQA